MQINGEALGGHCQLLPLRPCQRRGAQHLWPPVPLRGLRRLSVGGFAAKHITLREKKKKQSWMLLSPTSPSVLSPGDAGGGGGSALDTVGSVSPGLVAMAAPRPGRS